MELYQQGFKDYHFIVTSGPTREFLDPVRFISNPSSGKMGYYLAMECLKYSPHLYYVHGPIDSHYIPLMGNLHAVESTDDMLRALTQIIQKISDQKIVLIMAAAPADYKTKQKSERKIKKENQNLTIEFERNPDILKEINRLFHDNVSMLRVGFAAESHDSTKFGTQKLKEKNIDIIVINDITQKGIGFQSDSNQVEIISKNGDTQTVPLAHKQTIAGVILQLVTQMARTQK